jgi:hypothetical protein
VRIGQVVVGAQAAQHLQRAGVGEWVTPLIRLMMSQLVAVWVQHLCQGIHVGHLRGGKGQQA